MVKLDSVEIELGHLLEERKSVDRETQGLRNQLDKAEDMVRVRICSSLSAELQIRSNVLH